MPSAEKIKRVAVQPLPLQNGEVVESESKAKRFRVRVIPQMPGCFEMNQAAAVEVTVLARGKQAALDAVAERISGRYCYSDTSRADGGTCGRWYDGNMCRLEILSVEKNVAGIS